jgi:hypothetical protein
MRRPTRACGRHRPRIGTRRRDDADAPRPAAPKPAGSAGYHPPKPLLWKVSDGDNDLYLLGSFHALKPSDYPVRPPSTPPSRTPSWSPSRCLRKK